MITQQEYTFEEIFTYLLVAPAEYPDIIPNVAPLLAGLLVMEVYFGKHKQESLGWNTAVGNAVVWAATGIILLYSNQALDPLEMWLILFLTGAGVFILYMDFFHKWSRTVAFRVSSSTAIYLIAYVIVVLIETPIPVNEQTVYGSAAFAVISLGALKIGQLLMKPARSEVPGIRR